jgi:BlaI family transcriptional regulator, penicillinase repressor
MKPPIISDAEWNVMKALWDGGPASASEIVARVQSAGYQWHSRTVKTMLSRLVRKGAVRTEPDGNRFVYRPVFSRDVCVRHESKSFLARVFDGAAAPALVHFLEQTRLPAQEIERLRKLLQDSERKREKK